MSDQRFFVHRDQWYTTASFPLKELAGAFGTGVTHWTMFGRLVSLSEAPTGLHPIAIPQNIAVEFQGVHSARRGLGSHLRLLLPYLRAVRAAARSADVVWLKLPFVSSYMLALLPRPRRQIWLAHLVGDPRVAITSTLGPRYRALAEIAQVMTRWAVRRANLALFVSEDLKSRYGAGHPCAHVISESRVTRLDLAASPRPRLGDPLLLLYVGRLSPEKNLPVLVEALGELVRANMRVSLRVVGDGPQRADLVADVDRRGLRDRVAFHGVIPWGPDLFAVIRDADVLVLPSKTEGLPLVLVEAMSQGVPCVATAVGGVPEVIADGVNGRLVPPDDPRALARAIRWVADPLRYGELSAQCLRAAERFTMEHQLKLLAGAFREVSGLIMTSRGEILRR